jgi:hypothetical protein
VKLTTAGLLAVVSGLLVIACQATPAAPTATPVAVDLFVAGDTVQGPANLTDDEKAGGAVCVQKNRYARNEEIVWRFRVVDPATGQPMDDQALSSVIVRLPDQELEMHYGGHPSSDPVDFFWTVSFDVPADYPTGLLNYNVVATAAGGRTGTFNQFGVASAQLTITDAVRPVISQ